MNQVISCAKVGRIFIAENPLATLNSFRKKARRKPADPLASFQRKLERESLSEGRQIIFQPSRAERMSDVLTDFIEPYMHHADTEEAYRKLLTIGILAWNASMLEPAKRKEMIKSVLKGLKLGFWEQKDFRDIVETMVERKLKHFAENKRLIVNYELRDMGDQLHLSVASTPGTDEKRR